MKLTDASQVAPPVTGFPVLSNFRHVALPSTNNWFISTQTPCSCACRCVGVYSFIVSSWKHGRSYLIYLCHSQTPSTALYPCTSPLLLLALVTSHCTPYWLRPSTFHLRLLHSPRVWTTSNPSDPLNYSPFLSHQLCASHSYSSIYPSWSPCTYSVNSSSPEHLPCVHPSSYPKFPLHTSPFVLHNSSSHLNFHHSIIQGDLLGSSLRWARVKHSSQSP